jgi:hypothetical protein
VNGFAESFINGGQRTEGGGCITEGVGERIESFRELRVYRAAMELQQRVFEITNAFLFTDDMCEIFSFSNNLMISAGSTLRKQTWVAPTAVTAQGKHHPLQ